MPLLIKKELKNLLKELTGTSMGIAAAIIMGLPMLVQSLSGYLLDMGWCDD